MSSVEVSKEKRRKQLTHEYNRIAFVTGDELLYPHKVSIVFNRLYVIQRLNKQINWHAANRKWLEDKGFKFKFTSTLTGVNKHNISNDDVKTYYFKNEKEAMLFSLWCPRRL